MKRVAQAAERYVAGYPRVSTDIQMARDSLANQVQALEAFGVSRGGLPLRLYREEGVSAKDIERPALQQLLADVRAGKIEAVVHKARCAEQVIDREGSLAAFLWRHEPAAEELAEPQTASTSAASIALSKQLRKQGWKFVGPTTVYAFMQAMGLINDHSRECVTRALVQQQREAFTRPA